MGLRERKECLSQKMVIPLVEKEYRSRRISLGATGKESDSILGYVIEHTPEINVFN